MLVGVVQVIVTRMAQTLMPEQSFSGSLDGRHWSVLLNVLMERKGVEGGRELGHFFP